MDVWKKYHIFFKSMTKLDPPSTGFNISLKRRLSCGLSSQLPRRTKSPYGRPDRLTDNSPWTTYQKTSSRKIFLIRNNFCSLLSLMMENGDGPHFFNIFGSIFGHEQPLRPQTAGSRLDQGRWHPSWCVGTFFFLLTLCSGGWKCRSPIKTHYLLLFTTPSE